MNYKEKMKHIKALAFDCDGVFTDGRLTLSEDGYLARTFNARDGFAVQIALKKGLKVALITGAAELSVKKRFNALGVTDVFLNARDKTEAFYTFLDSYELTPEDVLYMGDDLPDIPLLEKVGLPCCPNDAVQEVKAVSEYISDAKGGDACVRDVIEQTLKVQGLWMAEEDVIIPAKF